MKKFQRNLFASPCGMFPHQLKECCLTYPSIGTREQFDQRIGGGGGEINRASGRGALGRKTPDPSSLSIDSPLIVTGVINSLFIKIADVDGTVGALLKIDRAKPRIRTRYRHVNIAGGNRRTIGENLTAYNLSLKWCHAKHAALIPNAQSPPLINQKRMRKTWSAVMFDRLKKSVRMRI